MEREVIAAADVKSLDVDSVFYWDDGQGRVIAEVPAFQKIPFGNGYYWAVDGYSGSGPEQNFYAYLFTLPYKNDEIIKRRFEFPHPEVSCSHGRSVGNEYHTYRAEDGELDITLDPKAGTAVGTYKARFTLEDGTSLRVKGGFNLKQDTKR